MIGEEKRDMWWLLNALYTKQINENSPPKANERRREKRYVEVTHSLIHQIIQ